MAQTKPIRVRIPPSPTGNLHVGTARTALFNELLARQQKGAFIVRIEDTDPVRSKKEYEENILEGLKWLGLTWQEGPDVGGDYGPYRQSERGAVYEKALQQLLDSGQAYLDGQAIKIKVAPEEISFEDLVRGTVTTHTDTFGGDFVIARSIKDPLYHLAVVVDDATMQISHVIRGEDHISNTAKHILIQRALGYEQPVYAHLPLLLDESRKKLSKRNGETSLLVYRELGYLPQAMLNYLALLGWNPGDDREFFTHDELAAAFRLEKIQKGGAIFSVQKLKAVNKHYIRQLSPTELMDAAVPFLTKAGLKIDNPERMTAALVLEQERADTLVDLSESVDFASADWKPDYPAELLVWKKSSREATAALLKQLSGFVETISPDQFTKESLQEFLMKWIDGNNLGRGDTLWPMRVALTGREHSPGPFEVAAVLGKEETVKRLQAAQQKLVE